MFMTSHTNPKISIHFSALTVIWKPIPSRRNQTSLPTHQRTPVKRTLCPIRGTCHVVVPNRCPPHRWAHPNQCAKPNRILTLPAPLTHSSERHRPLAVGFCPVYWAFIATLPRRTVPSRTSAKRPRKQLT